MQADGGGARPPRAGGQSPGPDGGSGEGAAPDEQRVEHAEPARDRGPEIHYIGSAASSEDGGAPLL
eukprot:4424424-Lingulodinium_polyedra.AAC.1